MAYRLKISTANAGLNGVTAKFPSGSICVIYKNTIPTDADTATSGQTVLATITTAADFAAASARSAAKGGTWQDASADGGSADAPTWFRLKNAADTERIDGTAGVGSGDMSFDGSITAAQVVTVTAFTITC